MAIKITTEYLQEIRTWSLLVTTLLLNALKVSLCTGQCYGFYSCKAQLKAIKIVVLSHLSCIYTKRNNFKTATDYAQAETF